ncbi:hypothetical protein MMC18_005808 [Xylographa bjoerkii]|nr:hypothetical protein [Xylographa bjoerkii]
MPALSTPISRRARVRKGAHPLHELLHRREGEQVERPYIEHLAAMRVAFDDPLYRIASLGARHGWKSPFRHRAGRSGAQLQGRSRLRIGDDDKPVSEVGCGRRYTGPFRVEEVTTESKRSG